MSRMAAHVVRLAAGTLPASLRDRYREEWAADVATASEAGVTPASVARGAIAFAVKLDRDAPEIAGASLPVIAQRHARWALALTGATAVVALARHLIGPVWLPVVIACILGAPVWLWRAARLGSASGKVSAALATVSLAALTAGSTIPGVNDIPFFYPVALFALVLSAALGVHAWTGASTMAVFGIVLVGAVAVVIANWYFFFNPFAIAAVATAIGLAGAMLSRTSNVTVSPRATKRTRVAVWVASAGLVLLLALGSLEALVVTPLWISPRSTLGEIFASVPADTLVMAVASVAIWAALCAVGIAGYLTIGLRFSRHAERSGTGLAILLAIAIAAAALTFQPFASFTLGQAISSSAGSGWVASSPFNTLVQVLAVVALVIAIVGWISPLRSRGTTKTPAPAPVA